MPCSRRRAFGSGLLSALLATHALADDYVVDTEVFETNGGYTLDGDDSITVTEHGSVTTSGVGEHGLDADGDSNTLSNRGTVTTYGDDAHGLYSSGPWKYGCVWLGACYSYLDVGNGNTLSNTGKVTTSGVGAAGVHARGDGNTVTNSGRILSDQSHSVVLDGSNATLTLVRGSVLQGDVHFSDPDTATLTFGTGVNAVVRTDGAVPATITAPDDAYVAGKNAVHVVDVRGFVVADQTIGWVGRLVLDALETRPSRGRPAEVSRGATRAAPVWAQGFGGSYDRPGDSDTAAYDGRAGGVLVGADTAPDRGFFFGATVSHLENDSGSELNAR